MKKKLFIFLLSIISVVCLAVGLTACGSRGSENQTISVTSVSLDKSSLDLTVGESYTLSATVSPSNATNTNVTWSSSATSVATVSGGKVTTVSEGTAVITVTTTDGGYTDTCSVTVTETQNTPSTISVTSVSLNETSLSLEAGGTYTLTATVLPSDATDKTVSWSSSDESVATVNNDVITAVAAGTATITVTTTDGNYTATCEITVTETKQEPEEPATVAVTSVTLDNSALALTVGDEYTLTATISPSDATNQNITWISTNENVISVENGKLTAIAAGTAVVIVTTEDGGKIATCTITVNEAPVAVVSVSLNTTSTILNVGDTYTLTATISPSDATNKNATWSSSNTSVATVSNGVITAVATGTATITVTTEDGNYTANCEVTVTNPIILVTSVSLNTNSLSLTVGGSSTLIATILPSDAINQNLTWSTSDNTIATISNGVVTAISAGTATITVTTEDGNYTAECVVTVKEKTPTTVAVTSVTLDKTSLNLDIGDTYTLTATILPSTATNQTVIWATSDDAVATISNGVVTAIAAGTATITVTTEDGGYNSSCTVTVSEPIIPVISVSLDKTTLSLNTGESATLTATILPSNTTNKNVAWSSSNTSVVTVLNGTITAVAAGTATITVTTEDGNYTADCEVTITDPVISVTSVSLDYSALSLTVGDNATLTATILPSNATNKNITWTSSNTNVAIVSDGKITAIGAGTAVIIVTTENEGKLATCTVTVKEATVSVTSISLNNTSLTLEIGETSTLIATILPSNATNQSVTWSSSNTSVATVSNGVITAVSAGTTIITVTTEDGGYTATCTVTVKEATVSVTSVSLNNTSLTLEIGETSTLIATILPSDATNQNVTWSSSNTSVATVSNGVITAVSAGTTIITVTTEDGNCTATCTITVAAATAAVLSVDNATINGNEIYLLAEHTTTSISLSGAVTCSSNSSWKLYSNDTITEIPTKVMAPLADGTNTYYIVVTSTLDSTVSNTYILTVYKSFAVTVNYYNGESVIKTETVYTGYTYFADYTPDITGYTFNYWKTADGQAYSATIISADLNLYSDTTAKTYTVTYDANGGTVNETETTVTYDSSYTFAIPKRTGYTFNGWYYGETQLTDEEGNSLTVWNYAENITVTADWSINAYTVTLELSEDSAGSVTGNNTYNYNLEVSITATSNSGYTWVGWYNGEKLLTSDLSYTFTMPAENVTYTAMWIQTTVVVSSSNNSVGSVSGLNNTNNILGNTITVVAAEPILGYTFLGWYNGDTQLTDDFSYSITITETSVEYLAKYEINSEMTNFEFTSTTKTCKITGIIDNTITEIVVPDYVTTISKGAFSGCSSLISITLPFIGGSSIATSASASTLFGYIFGTSSYTDGVETTQYYSSRSSGHYETYYIPVTLTTVSITGGNIFYGAFYHCYSLMNINLSNSATTIDEYAFYVCRSLTSISIPSSVTSIGNYAFSSCTSLSSVIIPDSVTEIGDYAFYDCSSLTIITIPNSVAIVGNDAFSGCTALTSVNIGNSVISIGCGAFHYCSSLTSVSFTNASGWYVSTSSSATSGSNVDVADTSKNVTYLTSRYYNYYWYRSV